MTTFALSPRSLSSTRGTTPTAFSPAQSSRAVSMPPPAPFAWSAPTPRAKSISKSPPAANVATIVPTGGIPLGTTTTGYVASPQARIVHVEPRIEPPHIQFRGILEQYMRNLETQVYELQRAILEERESRSPKKWSVHTERQARRFTDDKLAALSNDIRDCKNHVGQQHHWFNGNIRGILQSVEARGNIEVDLQTGRVDLLRPINFHKVTTGDSPTAEFSQPQLADAICADLAEVAKVFNCPLKVTGHTKGGESQFWQTLADDRARIVAEKMVQYGVDPSKITMNGLPGRTGANETKTEVQLQLPPGLLLDQPVMYVQPHFPFLHGDAPYYHGLDGSFYNRHPLDGTVLQHTVPVHVVKATGEDSPTNLGASMSPRPLSRTRAGTRSVPHLGYA
eukprot:gnl/TRDRNA2_/TRDRNA2_33111_c0_seq1.p1 gnl/TRDRNA2_/TRDRNA2_33111_c0~~gnl/TRDRNA2_/TRDRNA2_33111_c0_seq1.p1  ORF type:complete len:394 (+),score=64.31 gnl/TRDRNA2_/TRDRNA2_33111_c0_seq1:58-1239(+)